MTERLISVIIPTYGRPEMISGAVETVLEQTYRPIELIIVDDCSPDPIESHVQEMNLTNLKTVKCLRHEENKGASAARSTGIEAATGEFVAFLDDDDRWEPQKLETQINALAEWGENAGVAYTGMRFVNEDGETSRTHISTESGDLTQTLLFRNVVGSYSTILVRREAISDVGLPDPEFPSWQDLEWYIRLSREWEFVAVDAPLTIIYQADDHEQISDDFEAIRDESYPLFIEKFSPLADEYGRLFSRRVRAWAAFRVGGYNALRTGHFSDARRFLFRAVWLYPFVPKFWVYLFVALGGQRTYRVSKRMKRTVFS